MSDQLRHDLADLATEVEMVDLRDRAVRTSRRLAVRRATILGAAAVAVLGASTVTFLQVARSAAPADPAPTVSNTQTATPSPTVTQTRPTDFTFPAPPASATKLGEWTSKAAGAFPGTALFFRSTPNGNAAVQVLTNGSMRTSSLGALASSTSCIQNTVTFSPDGTRVAWVRGSIEAGADQLVSTDLATLKASAIADDVDCGLYPAWQADSRSIDFTRGAQPMTISLDTGQTAAGRGQLADYHTYVPGFVAYTGDENINIVVEDAGGAVVHRLRYEGWPWGVAVQALSYDGRYVGVSAHNTDPGRTYIVAKVIDMTTGKEITLPTPAGQMLRTLHFVPDGGMVMQTAAGDTSRLYRFDSQGKVLAQTALPSDAGLLLRYVP